jgi:hypothetical protein
MLRIRIVILAGTLTALLVATSAVGFAQSTEKQQKKDAIVSLAAAKLGLTSDQLEEALKQARKDLGAQGGFKLGKLVRDELNVAASTLGIADVKTLRQELRGSTLTAVAQKHNVAPATVASAIKADLNAKIDAMATSGSLKPERATKLKERAATKVDAFMLHEFK